MTGRQGDINNSIELIAAPLADGNEYIPNTAGVLDLGELA